MKVIWAMDAFEDDKDLNKRIVDWLKAFHLSAHAEVQPVYLLRENEIVLPTYEVPTWVTDHSKTAESLFKEVLGDYKLDFLLEPKVIPHASQSHAGAADTLSDYAVRSHADLIVVGSHGRTGFQRFILGSFAESLLLNCEIPVVVIGGHTEKIKESKHILFPTEFGEHSKDNFRHTLKLAKALGAEVTLFHAIARPIGSLFDLDTRPKVYNYKGQMLTLDQIVEHQIEHQTQRAQLWIDWAKKEGVVAHFQVDNSFKPVDELILSSVDRLNVDMIVMEAQSGPISAAILGSYTRNVVRQAHCPVYVITRHFYDQQESKFTDTSAP